MKKVLFILMVFFFSCDEEDKKTTPDPQPTLKQPAVTSTKILTANKVGLNSNKAVLVVTYEGFPELEYIFLEKSLNEKTLYVRRNGELVDGFRLDLIDYRNTLIAKMDQGSVHMTLNDENYVTSMYVNKIETPYRNSRMTRDHIGEFLACEDSVTTQASELICGGCSFGRLAWQVGCGAWAPCRWSWLATCVGFAILNE
jgi:hypothetical protein